jgi:hypothetical protein
MLDFFSASWVNHVQWPAMVATLLAAWLVGSNSPVRRNIGFWVFLASNLLWVAWGLHDGAMALIALQVGLATLNIRGVFKTEKAEQQQDHERRPAR